MNINKRGQATPFIIVGIIVVILVVVIIFISKPVALGGKLSISQVQPVKNYIDECIKNGADEKLSDLRKYGGYFSEGVQDLNYNGRSVLFDTTNNKILRGINSEFVIESSMNELLQRYLIDNCKVEDVFDDFSISKGNLGIKTDIQYENERVIVNVNWDVTIRKGIRSIKLNEFNYVKEDDVGWINEILVSYIKNKGHNPNEREYLDNNGEDRVYYEEGGETKGIKIINDGNYKIYSIKTRFDKKEDLDEFVFAVKYK